MTFENNICNIENQTLQWKKINIYNTPSGLVKDSDTVSKVQL
jgi:hypothetical protein